MGGRGSRFPGGNPIQGFLSRQSSVGGPVKRIPLDQLGDLTLQQAESRARNQKHEELFVFDKDGKLIDAFQGSATRVRFPSSVLNVDGATVTHGHPKGKANFGGTLSFADVQNMANSKWKEHRATAGGQGELNYIMLRTGKAKPAGLLNRINTDRTKLERQIKDTAQKAYNAAIKSGKSSAHANHIASQKGIGLLNRYWKNTLPKYGFEYITRKNPYPYQR